MLLVLKLLFLMKLRALKWKMESDAINKARDFCIISKRRELGECKKSVLANPMLLLLALNLLHFLVQRQQVWHLTVSLWRSQQ